MNEVNKSSIFLIVLVTVSQFTLFILKITGVINWGWEWILAPIWIPYATFIVFGIIMVLFIFICNIKERNLRKHE